MWVAVAHRNNGLVFCLEKWVSIMLPSLSCKPLGICSMCLHR